MEKGKRRWPMEIRIAPHHRREGVRCSPDMCPAALAIADHLGIGFHQVRVWANEIVLYLWRVPTVVGMPRPLARWILRYDAGDDPGELVFLL